MRFLNSVLLTTGRAHEQRLMGRQKFELSFGSRGRNSLSFLKKMLFWAVRVGIVRALQPQVRCKWEGRREFITADTKWLMVASDWEGALRMKHKVS